jgi:hypothetical protein
MKTLLDREMASTEDWRRRLLHRWIPMLIAGIIIGLISGGLPPKTWLYLARVCTSFGILWSIQGPVVLLSLFVLIIQSLLVGSAWGLWGWLLVQEGIAIWTRNKATSADPLVVTAPPAIQEITTRKPLLALPEADPRRLQNQALLPPTRVLQPWVMQSMLMQVEPQKALPQVGEPLTDPYESPLSWTRHQRYGALINPFEDNTEDVPSKNNAYRTGPQDESYDPYKVQLSTLDDLSDPKKTFLAHRQEFSQKVQPYPQPFKASVVDGTGQAVDEDAGEQTMRLPASKEASVEQSVAEFGSDFIFGNPFDGPLPDVFQEDEDLKQVLKEQTESSAKKRANRRKSS